jgi:hypothetical protein
MTGCKGWRGEELIGIDVLKCCKITGNGMALVKLCKHITPLHMFDSGEIEDIHTPRD